MAQLEPEYEAIPLFTEIAQQLLDKFALFMGLDANEIRCVGITNKEPPGDKDFWDIKAVPMPIRMDNPYSHYCICYMQDWLNLDKNHKQLQVFRALSRIPVGELKVLPPDTKEMRVVIKNFGVDCQTEDVPDILSDKFHLNFE